MNSAKSTEIRSDKKSAFLGTLAGYLMKLIHLTLRVEVVDEAGIRDKSDTLPPTIFALWHSRFFVVPPVWRKFFGKHRKNAALTSASHDGDMVACAMSVFGVKAIRGSSSRRGVAALVGLKRALKNGSDVSITPDGPRGPRYVVQGGIIKVAESSGSPIVQLHARFSSAWRIKSWDRFVIPKPFSKVVVTIAEPIYYERGMDAEALEQARQKLEASMRAGADDVEL